MNDLDAIRDFRKDVQADTSRNALQQARAALLQQARSSTVGAVRVGLPVRLRNMVPTLMSSLVRMERVSRSPLRRLGPTISVLTGMALIGALVVGAVLPDHNGHEATVNPESTMLLRRAAMVVSGLPALEPRQDQYLFTEKVTYYGGTKQREDGGFDEIQPTLRLNQQWKPVDGVREWAARSRPYPGDGPWTRESQYHQCPPPGSAQDAQGNPLPCQIEPPLLNDLPTDTDGMLDYLRRQTPGHHLDLRTFAVARDLLISRYITPAAMNSLFSALATIPGLTVMHDVVGIDGQRGVGVGVVTRNRSVRSHTRSDLIFDPETFRFLGQRGIDLNNHNEVVAGTAILRTAVVDRMWQLP